MSQSHVGSKLELPFLDLFQRLRRAGMALSPQQYDLLRQALGEGFGLANWEAQREDAYWDDLRQVCRVLWVKPSRNYDGEVFERTFRDYVQQKRQEIEAQQRALETATRPEKPAAPQPPARQLPQVPPRKMPGSEPPAEPEVKQAPTAVKMGQASLRAVDETGLHLTPTDLPLPKRAVLDSWRFLKRPLREGLHQELDLEATLERINQEGFFSDVVMRPVLSKKAELVVLVDDSNVMLPFRPAIAPLVQAIEAHQVSPAQLYRFTTYPEDYLYDWTVPSRGIPFDQVLSRLHRRRSIVLIWSEGGVLQSVAATPGYGEYRQGVLDFLVRLSPCVRNLIWLNPFPPKRWAGTLAAELACLLDGQMIQPTGEELLMLAKQPVLTDRVCLRRGM